MKSNKIISILCAISMISAVISAVPAMAEGNEPKLLFNALGAVGSGNGGGVFTRAEAISTDDNANWKSSIDNKHEIYTFSTVEGADNYFDISKLDSVTVTYGTPNDKCYYVIYLDDTEITPETSLENTGAFTKVDTSDMKVILPDEISEGEHSLYYSHYRYDKNTGELSSSWVANVMGLALNLSNPATSVEISSENYTERLYPGESFDLVFDVTAEDNSYDCTDEIVWTVTSGDTGDEINSEDYSIADGKFTLSNNAGRIGGTDGLVNIQATAGDVKSNILQIKTQRKVPCTYEITDASGDTPQVKAVATVNGEIRYTDDTINYGSKQHNSNNFSGHSNFKIEFTVPEGYTLSIDESDKYTVSTNGNIVSIYNENDIDDEFVVKGTITKNEQVSGVTLIKAMLGSTEESGYTANQDGTISKDGVTYYGYTTSEVSGTGKATVSVTSDDNETQSKTINTFIADASGKVIFNIISNKVLSAVSVDFN